MTQGRRYRRLRLGGRAALVDGGIRHRQGHRRRRLVVGDRQGYVHRIAHIATGGARYRHRATCALVDAVVRRRDRYRRAAAGGGARRNRQHLVGTQRRPRIIGYRHCYRGRLGARGAQGRRHRGRIARAALVDGAGRQGQGGGDVVVAVGDIHRDRVAAAVVAAVGTGRRQRQGVLDVAVYGVVVDAGHRHRLGTAPVGGRERQTGGTQRTLAAVQTGDLHRYLVRGPRRQFDREAILGGGLRGRQCGLAHHQARFVVGGAGVKGSAEAVVVRVGAFRRKRDRKFLSAVNEVIVDAGNHNCLSMIPGGGNERQRARICPKKVYRSLACIITAHPNDYVCARLAAQKYLDLVGAAGLGNNSRPAKLGEYQPRRVGIDDGDRYRIGHTVKAAGHSSGLPGGLTHRQRASPRRAVDYQVGGRVYPICKYSVAGMAASVHKYGMGISANGLATADERGGDRARVAVRKTGGHVKPRIAPRVVRQSHPNVAGAAFPNPARRGQRQHKAALVVDDGQDYVARQNSAGTDDCCRYRYTLVR